MPALADLDVSHNPGRLGHLENLRQMAVGSAVARAVRDVLAPHRVDAVLFHSLGKFWSDGVGNGPLNALLRPFGLAPLALLARADTLLLPTAERGVPPEPRMLGEPPLDGELGPRPNVEIRGRFSHAEILPHADLVIGHGGHSTTLKALAHGVPLLILPLDPTSDQSMIGKLVEAAGAGRSISRDATPVAIRDAVREILTDRDIMATAARIGEQLRARRGVETGADRIDAIAMSTP